MTRPRPGKTFTFSISVDAETRRILKAEARRTHAGNVSALIAALAKDAKRKAAFAKYLAGVPPMTNEERDEMVSEITGKPIVRRRRKRAA